MDIVRTRQVATECVVLNPVDEHDDETDGREDEVFQLQDDELAEVDIASVLWKRKIEDQEYDDEGEYPVHQ